MKYLAKITFALLAVATTISWATQNTSALTQLELQGILGGWQHFDPTESLPCGPGSSCACTAAGTTLVGEDNAEKIWNFLRGKGLSPTQAAGVMGNLQQESGFDPFNQQDDKDWPEGGWGIAQWTNPGRRDRIRDAVVSELGEQFYTSTEQAGGLKGTPAEDRLLQFQLEYLYDESNRREQRVPAMPSGYNASKVSDPNEWAGLLKTTTVEEAVIYWEWNYERAGDPQLGNRLKFANDILARFGGDLAGTPVGSVGGGHTACSSGDIVGNFAFPLGRAHYNQDPDNYLKPHHDYPSADIAAPTGTAVYAVAGGKIISAPTGGDCGLGVEIDVGNGIIMTYCHGVDGGSVPGAKQGNTVAAGQLIMHVGSTGESTGPHLHLQIKVNGELRCPQPLLEGIANGNPPSIESLPNSGCSY